MCFVFMHTTKSPEDKKKIILYFHTTKKIQKYVLACILTLITSLLNSQELDQYSKNNKKIILFFLVSGVTTLYVRCILDIKFFC
jgi:hypothetical protein